MLGSPAMDLFEETRHLLRTLEDAGASYALCGALAVAVHGAPRYTADIDLLVEATSLDAIIELAKQRGFVFGAAPMAFSDGVEVHRWSKIVEGEVLNLDLMVVSPGYQSVWKTRERVPLRDLTVTVLSREGLIQMKLVAGRPKDLMDVENLRSLDR